MKNVDFRVVAAIVTGFIGFVLFHIVLAGVVCIGTDYTFWTAFIEVIKIAFTIVYPAAIVITGTVFGLVCLHEWITMIPYRKNK